LPYHYAGAINTGCAYTRRLRQTKREGNAGTTANFKHMVTSAWRKKVNDPFIAHAVGRAAGKYPSRDMTQNPVRMGELAEEFPAQAH
jgi:hypothetical protein